MFIITREPSVFAPCARIKGVLVLSQPSDVYDLVPPRLVSCALLSPTSSATSHICLSQAYGCSDRYRYSLLFSLLSTVMYLSTTALFKIVVTPHFGYMGGHAKYKSGVHSYLVKLELWNSYPPCLARQPTDQHPHLPYTAGGSG